MSIRQLVRARARAYATVVGVLVAVVGVTAAAARPAASVAWVPGKVVVTTYAAAESVNADLLSYRVATRGYDVAPFAAEVSTILNDTRSWGAFRRVGRDDPAHFTIYLAPLGEVSQQCGPTNYIQGLMLSCAPSEEIWINAERWFTGSPLYPGDLASYRAYLINHEVGHQLGREHERCPGAGQPANVMQQQTLGLGGCALNSWPHP